MDIETITSAALDCLDDSGLDKLSMRQIAGRLGVQVGGLYYYLPDKAALLRAMANRICLDALSQVESGPDDGNWSERSVALCSAVRTTLRGHRDAARVLAAGPLIGSVGALALMDRLIDLLEAGVPGGVAAVAADTLMSYLTGFVLQEQADRSTLAWPEPVSELQARYPRVFRSTGTSDDDVFASAVQAIIDGFVATAG